MNGKIAPLVATVAVLSLAACGQPASESSQPESETSEPASTLVAGDADPTVVDPGHYSVELENDKVRVVRIAYGAGEESVMHYHPDSVVVHLTDTTVKMTMPDGSTGENASDAGGAEFTPGGQHLPKNISEASLEVLLVELKSGGSSAAETDGPDPADVDEDHYIVEFENDRVRIVRIAYDAGDESVMHYHPDSVAVALTDHLVQMTMPDGSTEEISANAGEAIFTPAGQHLPKNISETPWEVVLVELK